MTARQSGRRTYRRGVQAYRSKMADSEKMSNVFMTKLLVSGFMVLFVYISTKIDTPFTNGFNEKIGTILRTNVSIETIKGVYYGALRKIDSAGNTVKEVNGSDEEPGIGYGDGDIIIDNETLEEITELEDIYYNNQKK